MNTKIIEVARRVTASADQYLKYEVSAADWERYLEMSEGEETEAVYALRDAGLLTFKECQEELDEVFEAHDEQITISDSEGGSHD